MSAHKLDTSKNRHFGNPTHQKASSPSISRCDQAVFLRCQGHLAPFLAFWPSNGRTSPLKPQESPHVVGQIDHTDLGLGPGLADGTADGSHRPLLVGEDVLDLGATLPALHARYPASRKARSKRSNSPLMALALVKCSRNVQIVLASGTASAISRPRKRFQVSRSRMKYSVASSRIPFVACRIRTFSIST